jgi:hypothetical protein
MLEVLRPSAGARRSLAPRLHPVSSDCPAARRSGGERWGEGCGSVGALLRAQRGKLVGRRVRRRLRPDDDWVAATVTDYFDTTGAPPPPPFWPHAPATATDCSATDVCPSPWSPFRGSCLFYFCLGTRRLCLFLRIPRWCLWQDSALWFHWHVAFAVALVSAKCALGDSDGPAGWLKCLGFRV